MAQQEQKFRVKAKKMFKVSIGGGAPMMVNPGDVVDVDRYMFGMLVQSEKAERTDEKPFINPDYKAPERTASASDPVGLLTRAVDNLTRIVQELVGERQKKLSH
jgi:hypothetical protein